LDRLLLSGNEAIARGAWEAGASFGVGYPGTPSTEVLENFARFEAVRAEWAPNEKVALEVAAGMSLGGARVLCTMKHVGMNVAADALMTLSYTGVGGGLVILVADDPGMHSSQNEQDSRRWGPFAKVPVLELSDSGDAYRFTRDAFELSERFDTPVIVRSTVRVSHGKGLVEVGERTEVATAPYEKRAPKWVMMPGNAKARRVVVADRTEALTAWTETTPLTIEESGSPDAAFGVLTAGVSFQYVREVLPETPVLKLAASWPLPPDRIRAFAERAGGVAVVEELDPYLRESLLAMGVDVLPQDTGRIGELEPSRVRTAFGLAPSASRAPVEGLPPRPPMLCPGCPHRGVFAALRDMGAVVVGDIGCYTLGSLPPLSAMDTCVDMGASIGMGYGLGMTGSAGDRPVVSVIGDSTFAHSGLTGLMHEVYNAGDATVVVLDNRTTAMTGHQGNPISGSTLHGEEAPPIDLEAVCAALGATSVVRLNPLNLKRTRKVLEEEVARPGVSVVVAESPCVLLTRRDSDSTFAVDPLLCDACGACIALGCPAIAKSSDGRAVVDLALCVACTQCVQVCPEHAIKPAGPAGAPEEVGA
jgi:indolepyruvate ferredoxin oxidoreductase alpha subunit